MFFLVQLEIKCDHLSDYFISYLYEVIHDTFLMKITAFVGY